MCRMRRAAARERTRERRWARMLKLVVVAAAAACLALPAIASAEDGGHAVDHITCSDGTTLTPPFTPPVCAEHGGVASVSCVSGETLTPPLEGKRCGAEGEGAAQPPGGGDGEQQGEGDHHGDAPRFAAGFLNRVWRIAGSANGFEDGVLDFTADRFFKLPRKFARQDDAIVGEDSRVLVGERTRVFDADHNRFTGDATASALDDADDVVVVGKLMPRSKWQQDEDGTPVPTLRAKKILIQS
jgi:hypothetical protein